MTRPVGLSLLQHPVRRQHEGASTTTLSPAAERVDDTGRLVNTAGRAAETDATVLTAAGLAARVGVADRSLLRVLAERAG